ncbi:MAG: hypothetical protein JW956_06505 [Calditrichaceae bacterium]|nr:hypothetical protein [Calditrichaceae bacterium]HES59415.1 hypothetical protein [Caldithrix sp.]
MKNKIRQNKDIKYFSSFEEENKYEHDRRRKLSVIEMQQEFAALQARRWGADWIHKPIEKIASYERIS